jgi:hypothetical protein
MGGREVGKNTPVTDKVGDISVPPPENLEFKFEHAEDLETGGKKRNARQRARRVGSVPMLLLHVGLEGLRDHPR